MRTPLGSEGSHFLDARLDALDDVAGVLAVAHDDDAADGVALTVEVRDAPPHLGPQRDRADVTHEHRRAAFVGLEDDLLEVLLGAHVARARGP